MDLTSCFGLLPFTYAQAREAGVTDRQFRAIRGQLILQRRGVYLLQWADNARDRHCQRVAGLLLTKTDHFAVGMSAVAILGLPDPPFHNWDTQVPQLAGKKTRTARGISKSPAAPIPTDWGLCSDAVTTATHVAAQLELPEALMVTDAVARQLAGTDNRLVLASEECRLRVRRILTEDSDLPALALANPAAEAASESFYRGHMILHGYEDPACGVPRIDAKGSQRYIDILLETLAIEVDGDGKLQSLDDLRDEKEREDDLRLTGLDFLRPRVKQLYADPAARMAELDRKVAQVHRMTLRTG